MKVGVIFVGYGCREYIERSLQPWIDLRKRAQEANVHQILICGISLRFAGFGGEDDGTGDFLRAALVRGDIDHLIDGPNNIPETTARGMGLQWIKERGADLSVQWDADEVAWEHELNRMLGYVDQNPFIAAFRFSYRNLVFTPAQWLAEPFTPMRVHRIKFQSYEADRFYDDNSIMYRGTITRDFRQDVSFATMTIPSPILDPVHYTWLSDTEESKKRSINKVKYQTSRGWQCSFSVDENGDLIFNPDLPIPKIARD